MRIEPKAAFYNEETGAVQPWKDIEVTDSVGNALVSEGLAIAIAEGGGGGGETEYVEVTFQLEEGLAGAFVYGFFIFDYGQEGEYFSPYFGIESGTTTVHVPLYKGNGCVYAMTGGGSNCWFEGSNISEYGVITGSDTVTIHKVTD